MAFKFRSKSSLPITNKLAVGQVGDGISGGGGEIPDILPKFTNAQLNKLAKEYPSWLKDKSGPKQLPGIYQGVLGQVQLQPGLSFDNQMLTNGQKLLLTNKSQMDYMNRFTDTERVHQLLSASQLSNDTLATIWAHVNQTFPGKLTNREVCLALALIAIFQRFGQDELSTFEALKRDPFNLVKAEKKPPVPMLYSASQANKHLSTKSPTSRSHISSPKSTPEKLSSSASSGALLVDFGDENEATDRGGSEPSNYSSWGNISATSTKINEASKHELAAKPMAARQASNSLNLIDIIDGGYMFEIEFFKLTQIWLKFLNAIKTIFKRSFDILNVENSRQSAIEALKSEHGKQFSRHLCLCYPIAHNIRLKIDQLDKIDIRLSGDKQKVCTDDMINDQDNKLFDKNCISTIDDLMNSVNEYWAVLINLFHESGQTKFIELIMDGLNYERPTVVSRTIGELSEELNGLGKPDVCSICHTNFYLTSTIAGSGSELSPIVDLDDADSDLIGGVAKLISDDNQYYYHARCANFWLNSVDSSGLPACKKSEENILSPASTNLL